MTTILFRPSLRAKQQCYFEVKNKKSTLNLLKSNSLYHKHVSYTECLFISARPHMRASKGCCRLTLYVW